MHIGRNFTAKCDIIHTNGNYLRLPNSLRMPIENVDLHSFLPSPLCLNGQSANGTCFHAKLFCATAVDAHSSNERYWQDLKKIIDKVHKHVCGHATLSDMKNIA